MSELKHTQGTWMINDQCAEPGYGIAIDADHAEFGIIEICTVYGTKNVAEINEESKANAHLIAAAPELLEALKKAVETTYSDTLHAEWTVLIRKATGEQQ